MTHCRLAFEIFWRRLVSAQASIAWSIGLCLSNFVGAAENPAIVGKNDWLFVRHEIVLEELDKDTQKSLNVIERFNRLLARHQITLAVVVVPSKLETYAEQLPDGFQVSAYMKGFNDAVHNALRAGGVQTIDLKKALRHGALQNTNSPVFFRLDTHWTPTGALLAAQTIQATIMASSSLKKALDAAPVENYKLSWATKANRQVKTRDITRFLPVGAPEYPPEEVMRFKVSRENGKRVSLLEGGGGGGVSLVGSSFSGDWTGFPDALRYTLQRDIVSFSVNADAGQWAVMRAYLRDDTFQINRPKLVIWEMPERAVGWRPNYPFRDERYRVDDNEWLLQVAALVPQACAPAAITAKLEPPDGVNKGKGAVAGTATQEADFVEISFDKPVDHHSYLSARVTADGSNQITMEAFEGGGGLMRKFSIDVAGDELAHMLKTPLSLNGKGVRRIKLYPGKTHAFAMADVKVCRYPEN